MIIRERIKSETAQAHSATEGVSYAREIMDGSLTVAQYTHLIKGNYLLNQAWEAQWSNLPFDVPADLKLEHRRKTDMLIKDLELLGEEVPAPLGVTFSMETYPQFMGGLYVFEGSTLGGAVIQKQLVKNELLASLGAFHFYSGYGPNTGMMWKTFLDELVKITKEDDVNSAIEAANDAFKHVHGVFDASVA